MWSVQCSARAWSGAHVRSCIPSVPTRQENTEISRRLVRLFRYLTQDCDDYGLHHLGSWTQWLDIVSLQLQVVCKALRSASTLPPVLHSTYATCPSWTAVAALPTRQRHMFWRPSPVQFRQRFGLRRHSTESPISSGWYSRARSPAQMPASRCK